VVAKVAIDKANVDGKVTVVKTTMAARIGNSKFEGTDAEVSTRLIL
jgi:hypothetical protein